MLAGTLVLLVVLGAPAAAAPQVEQRAFEEIPNGVFIRGGSTVINADPRCPDGCPERQTCRQVCEDRLCGADAPSGALCSACRWRCAD